ncbi:thiamine pyrophosphate-binding protein [Corynebacterium stationis]|uniref:thiamine pyrophosphate-binding protein n=1 Tax=Corynebacterium stationis TaxID=1705 RepID=UPI001762459D|nr:thiamine pyrophosphate-binding protein [Corynebacterium stationis]HHT58640.1 hypothetical protein [Corynebacterium stationis]
MLLLLALVRQDIEPRPGGQDKRRYRAHAEASEENSQQITDKIAVATTTYGPGFTNTTNALVESAKARVPFVLVIGSAPQDSPRPWAIDQAGLTGSFGVRTFTAHR